MYLGFDTSNYTTSAAMFDGNDIIQAKKLLSESDLSILEVAGRCGFNNISYFNRLFKKKYSLTPRELRS